MGREFPGDPVIRTPRFLCPGSIPDQGTKIPQATPWGSKKKKDNGKSGDHQKARALCEETVASYSPFLPCEVMNPAVQDLARF